MDDGNSKNSVLLKRFELITFKAAPSGQKIGFNIGSNRADFTGKPSKRNIKMILNGNFGNSKSVFINGRRSSKVLPVTNADGKASGKYFFTFNFSGLPVNIEIK